MIHTQAKAKNQSLYLCKEMQNIKIEEKKLNWKMLSS
jgi:hypothetical protein